MPVSHRWYHLKMSSNIQTISWNRYLVVSTIYLRWSLCQTGSSTLSRARRWTRCIASPPSRRRTRKSARSPKVNNVRKRFSCCHVYGWTWRQNMFRVNRNRAKTILSRLSIARLSRVSQMKTFSLQDFSIKVQNLNREYELNMNPKFWDFDIGILAKLKNSNQSVTLRIVKNC